MAHGGSQKLNCQAENSDEPDLRPLHGVAVVLLGLPVGILAEGSGAVSDYVACSLDPFLLLGSLV